MTYKVLISSGCSFSVTRPNQKNFTWPHYLEQRLRPEHAIHMGLESQGNGIISRHVVYQVSQCLSQHAPEDLLVAVMWSSPDRCDFYFPDADPAQDIKTQIISGNDYPWLVINPHWGSTLTQQWYTRWHHRLDSLIKSYENILRTQWFLKQCGVSYVMGTITKHVFPEDTRDHAEIRYLHDLVDWTHFFPVVGEWEWAAHESGLPFEPPDLAHPSKDQHRLFVDKIIWPLMEKLNYV